MADTFSPKLVTRAYFSFIYCAGSIFESIFEARVPPVLRSPPTHGGIREIGRLNQVILLLIV